MTTTADPPPQFKVLGTRPIRHDGMEKVTGQARYGADIHPPGLLHGKILRSPHAHARIKSIDTSKAEALDGVRAVITNADYPIVSNTSIDLAEVLMNARVMAENDLAGEKVLYKGHAVVAVVAVSPHVAEEALDLIDVEYEVLDPLMTVDEAMAPGAPLLHEDMTTHTLAARFTRGTDTGERSNIASRLLFEGGDREKAFTEADVIVERDFRTKAVHQGYIEPHSSTASWTPDGHVTIWTSTQGAFGIRSSVAAILRIPEAKIKVVPLEMGGGFGGKISSYLDAVAAIASRKTGHPVKFTMTRKEVFEGTGPTSGTHIKAKIGAKKDGTIVAADLWLAYEAGAYPGSPVGAGVMYGMAPYAIENFAVDGYDVVVNKPKVAAYRAPGTPQAAFAMEQVVDQLARELGMDPIELRLKNVQREGGRQVNGIPYGAIGCEEVERAMLESEHYKSKLEGPNRGRGVAMGFWGNGGMHSAATLAVNAEGTVNMVTGSVDLCGTRVALAMQVAEVLGLRAEDIVPTVGDTDSVGFTAPSGGSRTAFATGIAVIQAAHKIVDHLKAFAGRMWELPPEEIAFENGVFVNPKDAEENKTFKQLAMMAFRQGAVTASASVNPGGVGVAYAGHIADVEVDPETGKITVLRYTTFQDVGRAVHPSYVEGQMQGGAVQGIGWALNEEYFWTDDGTMANSSFLDYRMPTSLDLPMIETQIVEKPNPGHPFGLRGVGEVSIVPPMAAIANAVVDAAGARLTELPMSPGAVLKAMQKQQGS